MTMPACRCGVDPPPAPRWRRTPCPPARGRPGRAWGRRGRGPVCRRHRVSGGEQLFRGLRRLSPGPVPVSKGGQVGGAGRSGTRVVEVPGPDAGDLGRHPLRPLHRKSRAVSRIRRLTCGSPPQAPDGQRTSRMLERYMLERQEKSAPDRWRIRFTDIRFGRRLWRQAQSSTSSGRVPSALPSAAIWIFSTRSSARFRRASQWRRSTAPRS